MSDATLPQRPHREAERANSFNITEVNRPGLQLRIPQAVTSILSAEAACIRVALGGEVEIVSLDPRTDDARERSGIMRAGRALLADHVCASDPREINLAQDGTVLIS
ncbi:hypothetical protein [Pseudoclavibacter helvolus]|uniref:hypothetical protein n=1 Tax=Pseudoclavibacter helvolus TaxID=255205 RepID=UPI0012E87277|nr:hypothetical protein [Pseudoclavibacter helvolus]